MKTPLTPLIDNGIIEVDESIFDEQLYSDDDNDESAFDIILMNPIDTIY